jgi:hypothetical protein
MSVFRAIFTFFCEIFLSCSHSHLTRIFTVNQETYRVCLDCGKHIAYSPMTMHPLTARELRRMKVARAGKLKIMPVTISSNAASQTVESKSCVA